MGLSATALVTPWNIVKECHSNVSTNQDRLFRFNRLTQTTCKHSQMYAVTCDEFNFLPSDLKRFCVKNTNKSKHDHHEP